MSKKQKNAELTIKGQFDLKNTPAILEKLDSALAELKRVEESPYKTSGNLEGFGDIKSEMKIDNLVKAYSSVKGRANAYADASVDLKLSKVPAFSISGGTVDDWKHDIQLRIEIITYQDKYNKLKEAKDKLSKFLSEEDQKMMILKNLQDVLNGEE